MRRQPQAECQAASSWWLTGWVAYWRWWGSVQVQWPSGVMVRVQPAWCLTRWWCLQTATRLPERVPPVHSTGQGDLGATGIRRLGGGYLAPVQTESFDLSQLRIYCRQLRTDYRTGCRYDNEDPYRHDQTKYPDDERSDRQTAACLVVGPGLSH